MKEIKINNRYYYELECERCKKIFTKRKDYYKTSLKKCNGKVLCKNCAGMKYDENITEKPCTKCKKVKPLAEFRKRKNGLRSECKQCQREYAKIQGKIYREKNRETLIKKRKEYYEKNKEKVLASHKKYKENRSQELIDREKESKRKWRENNKDKAKEYREKNKEIIKEKQRIRYQNNKEEYARKSKIYRENHKEEKRLQDKRYREEHREELNKKQLQRKKNNPVYKLKCNLRGMIKNSFRRRGFKKKQKGEKIYGCSVNELIEHLIKTYENNYNEKWDWKYLKDVHVDHIIPLASANTEEDVIKLCHYSNLQLLKAKDNLDKKDSLEWELKQ